MCFLPFCNHEAGMLLTQVFVLVVFILGSAKMSGKSGKKDNKMRIRAFPVSQFIFYT